MDPLFPRANNPQQPTPTASPWPAEPVWAPPIGAPPIASPISSPSPRVSAAHERRRWPAIAAATVAVAILAGGGAGYAGAILANDEPVTTVTQPVAEPLTYAGTTLDIAAVVAAVEPSVVTIQSTIEVRNGFRSGTAEAAGTGILLTADGEILTNAHVVAGATSVTVTLSGETTPRRAVLIGADTANDVALIKLVDASGLTPATLADSDNVAVGDDAIAIGNALGLEGDVTVTRGIISALNRSIDVESGTLRHLIQTDAAISSGNSGGPLVNGAAEIVGMNTAGAASSANVTAENIGFAIPINAALAIVDQLRALA